MSSALRLECCAFRQHKLGALPSDWEDGAGLSEVRGRIAIADGASAAFGARQWSRLLVEGWCTSDMGHRRDVPRWVDEMRQRWAAHLLEEPSVSLPAYLESHRRGSGAVSYATFVGLEFDYSITAERLVYSGVGIGDSVMIHLRGGQAIATFPVRLDVFQFTDTPSLLATRSGPDDAEFVAFEGEASLGDVFLLLTDALAECFRDRAMNDSQAWPALSSIDSTEFGRLVDLLRDRGNLVNDDVTLVRARVERADDLMSC